MSETLLSPEAPERSANDERRAAPRFVVRLRVRWHPFPQRDLGTQLGQVHDISTLGIGLLLGYRLDISTFLDLELLDGRGHVIRHLQARVVHVEEISPDQWLIGCAFVTELAAADLSPFHADAAATSGPDNRRWTRFPCNVETVCYTSETAPGERRSGRILNISAGGIGLMLRCSFYQGTLLYFDLPTPGRITRQMLIRVVRVVEHTRGNWFLGCEFAAKLSDDELQALVTMFD